MKVYRNFQDANYAAALADGKVWLGTLTDYRNCEDRGRGDPNEGFKIYTSGVITGDAGQADLETVASRLGVTLGESKGTTFENCGSFQTIRDAYVLCTSTIRITDELELKTFGQHTVEILDTCIFAHRVTKALEARFRQDFRLVQGPVSYSGNKFHHLDQDPGTVGFVKDASYSKQHEYRFLWTSSETHHNYQGVLIDVPRVQSLCRPLPIAVR